MTPVLRPPSSLESVLAPMEHIPDAALVFLVLCSPLDPGLAILNSLVNFLMPVSQFLKLYYVWSFQLTTMGGAKLLGLPSQPVEFLIF